jgi:hypothetical protein
MEVREKTVKATSIFNNISLLNPFLIQDSSLFQHSHVAFMDRHSEIHGFSRSLSKNQEFRTATQTVSRLICLILEKKKGVVKCSQVVHSRRRRGTMALKIMQRLIFARKRRSSVKNNKE